MKIGVVGAGAFGTALAVSLAANGPVWLWGRAGMEAVAASRTTPRLPGITLPEAVHITGDINGLAGCDVLLLAMPMQALADTLPTLSGLRARYAVACCKGIDRTRLTGPAERDGAGDAVERGIGPCR